MIVSWLTMNLKKIDLSFVETPYDIIVMMLKDFKRPNDCPTSHECLFDKQYRALFPEYGTKCEPSLAMQYVENQRVPIDPQRFNRSAIQIEGDDWLHDEAEWEPRE